MKLTKYAHACVALTDGITTIVIDPGVFTPDVEDIVDDAQAVLITHEHADHIDPDKLTAALPARSDLTVYGPSKVVDLLGGASDNVRLVKDGDDFSVGAFDIKVIGEMHEPIHRDNPAMQNVCYLIDSKVFHPGDSFTVPGVPVDVLLLPTSGPWFKLADAVDYVRAVKPNRIIEIHEKINSRLGSNLVADTLSKEGMTGLTLEQLAHGQSTEI
jgi:L-ascorbate metabolism protein UlaG (beta-lactamase superfamily)